MRPLPGKPALERKGPNLYSCSALVLLLIAACASDSADDGLAAMSSSPGSSSVSSSGTGPSAPAALNTAGGTLPNGVGPVNVPGNPSPMPGNPTPDGSVASNPMPGQGNAGANGVSGAANVPATGGAGGTGNVGSSRAGGSNLPGSGGMTTGGSNTGGVGEPSAGAHTGGTTPEGGSGGTQSGSAGAPGGTGGNPEPAPDPGVDFGGLVGFATLNGGTTGGEGGEVVTAASYADLVSYAESNTPYIIMVEGTITNGSAGGRVRVASNKSIIGVGDSAFLSGVGIDINGRNNIIIQNIRATLVGASDPSSVNGGDVISIQGTSRNIWIDHCELFSEDPNVQTDIDRYDGLVDIKHESGFITISWNHIHDHHKGGLVGAADDDLYTDRKITYHHNYYDNVKLRVPMYRGAVGHFFNNYIVGAQDATELRVGVCMRVERNYYEELRYSIYTPNDAPGNAERIDNIEIGGSDRGYPGNCTADIPYSYSDVLISNTEDVKTLVPAGAGVGKL